MVLICSGGDNRSWGGVDNMPIKLGCEGYSRGTGEGQDQYDA